MDERNYFLETPNVIAYTCFHRWCHALAGMNPAETVVHVV